MFVFDCVGFLHVMQHFLIRIPMPTWVHLPVERSSKNSPRISLSPSTVIVPEKTCVGVVSKENPKSTLLLVISYIYLCLFWLDTMSWCRTGRHRCGKSIDRICCQCCNTVLSPGYFIASRSNEVGNRIHHYHLFIYIYVVYSWISLSLSVNRFKAYNVPSNVIKAVSDFCTVYVISKGKVSTVRHASRVVPPSSPIMDQITNLNKQRNSTDRKFTHSVRGLYLLYPSILAIPSCTVHTLEIQNESYVFHFYTEKQPKKPHMPDDSIK